MSKVTAPQRLIKQPSENRQYSMDFSNVLSAGETISTQVVTSQLACGDSSDLTITGEAISGQTVTCWIAGGTHGNVYRVEFVITTSTSQTVEGDGILYVKDE